MTIDILKTLPNNTKCASVSAPVRRVSSVRRSLFGEVDHDDCMNFLKKELDAIAESQKKKWNFDFSIEKPTDSTEFEWTPVQPDEPIPKPYALTRLPYLYEHTENSPSKVQQNEVTMSKTLRQTYLDGYIKSRKRNVVISSNESCSSCKTESSDAHTQCTCYHPSSKKLCLTPSKNPQD